MNISENLTHADQIDEIYREAEALEKFDHKNIVHLIKAFVKKKEVIMVMEYCGGGELFEYVMKRGHLDELVSREIF